MTELHEQGFDNLVERALLVHQTDEELSLYHDNVADDVTRARIAVHLRRCLICSRRYDMTKHILATYHEVEVPPESIEQLKALIAQMPPPQGVPLFLLERVRRFGAAAAGERETGKRKIQDGQTEDGVLRWQIIDEYGDLVVRFYSYHVELEGFKITLRAGSLRKTATLQRKAEDQVGEELIITREELKKLPDDAGLIIESMTPPEQAGLK